MQSINSGLRFLSLGVIFSFLLPVVKVGDIGFKLDLVFCLLLIPYLFLQKQSSSLVRQIVFLTICIFVSITISNNVGLFYYSPDYSFRFPSDFYQTFSRTCGFLIFYYIALNKIMSYSFFVRITSYVFLLSLLFGLVQFFGISVIDNISLRYYALSDTQMSGFQSDNFRGFGTAGNILTWGGLCCMMFYFAYFLCETKKMKLLICVLALFNILITASRAAILALILSFLFLQFYKSVLIRGKVLKFIKNILFYFVVGISIIVIGWVLNPDRFELLMIRFLKAEEDMTQSGRGAQIEFFLTYFNTDLFNYVFGLGKPILNTLSYMEIEPFFLLFAYGVVGLVLHYLLVFYVYRYVKRFKFVDEKVSLFIVVSLFCYLVFSLGFFFFREAYSGMFYWCVLGFLCGFLELSRRA